MTKQQYNQIVKAVYDKIMYIYGEFFKYEYVEQSIQEPDRLRYNDINTYEKHILLNQQAGIGPNLKYSLDFKNDHYELYAYDEYKEVMFDEKFTEIDYNIKTDSFIDFAKQFKITKNVDLSIFE